MQAGERETVFEHADGNNWWIISTSERVWINKLLKLEKQHPSEIRCQAVDADGGVCYRIPPGWISIRPPRKSNMTDAQKAEFAKRMRNSKQKGKK